MSMMTLLTAAAFALIGFAAAATTAAPEKGECDETLLDRKYDSCVALLHSGTDPERILHFQLLL